jgi:tetratricopeptide (TPR) repeat protein
MHFGDHEEARRLLDESLVLLRGVGSVSGESEVLGALAYLLYDEGDPAAAIEPFTRAAEMAADVGFTWWEIGMLQGLCECLIQVGRIDEAEAAARKELTLARKIGDRQGLVYGLVHFAWIAVLRGDEERAGRLWGTVEAEEARAPVGQWETEREDYAGRICRESPGFTRAREDGRLLPLERAVAEALAGGRAAAGA